MDVWIDFVAECELGFIKGGAYLTDIWSMGDDTDYTDKMFIRVYHE